MTVKVSVVFRNVRIDEMIFEIIYEYIFEQTMNRANKSKITKCFIFPFLFTFVSF